MADNVARITLNNGVDVYGEGRGERLIGRLRTERREPRGRGQSEGRRTDPAWVADAGGYELHIRRSLVDVAHMVPKTVAPSAALH
jgi:hypothetical protein